LKAYHQTQYILLTFLKLCLLLFIIGEGHAQQESAPPAAPANPFAAGAPGASLTNPAGNAPPQGVPGAMDAANASAQEQSQARQVQREQAESIVRQEREREKSQGGPRINTTSPTGGNPGERDLTNLTDAEKVLSEDYIHQGLINRMMKEECSGDNAVLCQGGDPSQRGFMIQALARAYGMIAGATDGKLERRSSGESASGDVSDGGTDVADADGEAGGEAGGEGEQEDSEVNDYCKYIAVGTEAFAMFQQQFAQTSLSELPTNADTAQRDSLLKAVISHEERAKQAEFQTMGWGATAACYWGMLTVAQLNWSLGLKIGGSTLLAGFFHAEIKRQKGYADQIRTLADKLPGKGDCNPVTERLCYCAQPETMNDAEFCILEMRQRHTSENLMTTTCIDSRAQSDPQCQCLDTDSCFDRKIENDLRGVGFGNLELSGIKPIQEMSRGGLSAGTLGSTSRTISALNDRFERNPEIKNLLNSRDLSSGQKELADSLLKGGQGPTLSRMMGHSPSQAASSANTARFQGWSPNFDPSLYKSGSAGARDNTLRFQGGYGLSDSPSANGNQNAGMPDIFNKMKQKQEREPANNVLSFAEKAQQNAQISRRVDTPLFEIISHRYRLSGWTRLPMDLDDDE
jgi:hypothetical protein